MRQQPAEKLWEYKEISVPRDVSRETTRLYLTGIAETDHWELDRLHLYPDGRKKVWLRRRIYKVVRTA
jgi:hypothetical protein